ncbi:hypothetical protein ACH4UR_25505 [Streptomyces lydicus]|uniref:hypothetical protein n=1 Tax=Streptomyces lydicus TaxID=47763 RepID=UPI0033F2DEA0
MDFQLRTGTQTITVTVTDPDDPAPIQIDCDGRALAGLDLRADGTLTLGHWPDGEQWETVPTRQQTAARLFGFTMGQAQLRRHGFATRVQPTAAEEAKERGMVYGPHRIFNTGDDIEHTAQDGGKYGVNAFECTRCHRRAILAAFEYGRVECTQEAEDEWSRKRAEGLLSDHSFKGAASYEVDVPTDDRGGSVTYTHDRETTVRFVAALLGLGATIGWFRDGLRLTHECNANKVRPKLTTGPESAQEAEEHPMDDPEEAVNLATRFAPQDRAEKESRPCMVLATGEQVYAYRKGGRLVVSVDLDGMPADSSLLPMVITVQGREVFTADDKHDTVRDVRTVVGEFLERERDDHNEQAARGEDVSSHPYKALARLDALRDY